jgi:hypothetical protein
VPVWPGDTGVATVDVTAVEPVYSEVSVVYAAGAKTTTVPVWPGDAGVATVDVIGVEPAYSEVSVV